MLLLLRLLQHTSLTMPSFARLPTSPRPAGYYTTNDTRVSGAVGFTCIPCGDGNFCAGAKASAASSATRVPCGQFTSTSGNQYATSSTQCSERPLSQPASLCLSLLGWVGPQPLHPHSSAPAEVVAGYGWGSGNTSTVCPKGF